MNQVISSDEMARQYLAADDKDLCISSLAQLNDCLPGQIRHILETAGAFDANRALSERKTSKIASDAKGTGRTADALKAVTEAVRGISALEYARSAGEPLVPMKDGWHRSAACPSHLFSPDGGFWDRSTGRKGGALLYAMVRDGLGRGEAAVHLLVMFRPEAYEMLRTRNEHAPDEDRVRMRPAERLHGAVPEKAKGSRERTDSHEHER